MSHRCHKRALHRVVMAIRDHGTAPDSPAGQEIYW